jgi:hypothetical protein
MSLLNPKTITITAKSIYGSLYVSEINPTITVKDYKALLCETHLKRPVTITLVYLGKIMSDEQTLESSGITTDAMVMMVTKDIIPPPIMNTDIDQLVAMGFDRDICVQTYDACDKNLQNTINILLND